MSNPTREQSIKLTEVVAGENLLTAREYVTPCLVEYGNLAHLTQFGGSGSSDFMGMQEGMGG
jgi:hypothetical protein